MSGKNSPEYKVIQGHFHPLVSNFEHSLPQLATGFFTKKLISDAELANAVSSQPAFEKGTFLLRGILKKVEWDVKKYHVFMDVLLEHSNLEDLVKELDSSLRKERDCYFPVVFSKDMPLSQQGIPRGRSRSDSSALKSLSSGSLGTEKDSAFFDSDHSMFSSDTEFQTGGVVRQGQDSGSFDKQLPPSNQSDNAPFPIAQSEVTWEFPFALAGATNTLQPYRAATPPYDPDPVGHSIGDCHHQSPIQAASVEEQTKFHSMHNYGVLESGAAIIQSAGHTTVHHHCRIQIASLKKDNKKQEVEIEFLRSQHDQKEHELGELMDESAKNLREHGKVVSNRDNIIKNLKGDQVKKDKLIRDLRNEKAEIEKRINELNVSYRDAVKKQELAEQKTQAVKVEFQLRVDVLTKERDKVQEREEKAVIALANIKAELVEAELAKEREMNILREETHALDKIRIKLESEKERAELAKVNELTEKDNVLLSSKTELAESKQKIAEMEAQRATEKYESMKKQLEALELGQKAL